MVNTLLNIGLYSPNQAASLVSLPTRKVSRWLLSPTHESLWRSEPLSLGVQGALSFKDLLSLRAVCLLRKHHVSIQVIRNCINVSVDQDRSPYPFIQTSLSKQVRSILIEALSKKSAGVIGALPADIFLDQIVVSGLINGIEFDQVGQPICWVPNADTPSVQLTPAYSFGKPIVRPSGMRTEAIARAVSLEKSVEYITKAYLVTENEIQQAIRFEHSLSTGPI